MTFSSCIEGIIYVYIFVTDSFKLLVPKEIYTKPKLS